MRSRTVTPREWKPAPAKHEHALLVTGVVSHSDQLVNWTGLTDPPGKAWSWWSA